MRRQEGTVRVRKREASDRHEGLRVVVLRQLAGARRGIEIANAHYGYFPIEGRIPLAPPSPSLFPLPRLFFLPRFSISRAHTHIHVHIPPLFFGFLSTVPYTSSSPRARVTPFLSLFISLIPRFLPVPSSLPFCPFHLACLTPRGLQIPDAMYAYPLAIILVQVILTMKANVLLFPLLINGH